MMIKQQSWYGIVNHNDPLRQGQLVKEVPLFDLLTSYSIASGEQEREISNPVDKIIYDIVILTQTCDLEQGKTSNVVVCPYREISSYDNYISNNFIKQLNETRKGRIHNLHLLDRCDIESYEMDYILLDFYQTYTVAIEYLKYYASRQQRLELQSPYVEQLSQRFGYLFMRVALPNDLPPFNKKT